VDFSSDEDSDLSDQATPEASPRSATFGTPIAILDPDDELQHAVAPAPSIKPTRPFIPKLPLHKLPQGPNYEYKEPPPKQKKRKARRLMTPSEEGDEDIEAGDGRRVHFEDDDDIGVPLAARVGALSSSGLDQAPPPTEIGRPIPGLISKAVPAADGDTELLLGGTERTYKRESLIARVGGLVPDSRASRLLLGTALVLITTGYGSLTVGAQPAVDLYSKNMGQLRELIAGACFVAALATIGYLISISCPQQSAKAADWTDRTKSKLREKASKSKKNVASALRSGAPRVRRAGPSWQQLA